MSRRLPRLIGTVLRLVVPARSRDQVQADLADDYGRALAARSRGAAAAWLVREAASLAWAYGGDAFGRTRTWAPLWARDARLLLRGLRRSPVTTVGAAATLAAGLLAALLTAGLSAALLQRPVSATHGDAVRRVAAVDASGRISYRLSFMELERVREHVGPDGALAAANLQPVVLSAGRVDTQTMAEVVDSRYFDLVGPRMMLGRGLVSADDRPAAAPVVVISAPLWRRVFSADPDIVGKTIALNRASFTVVGVMSSSGSATEMGGAVDAWAPLAHGDALLSAGWRTDPSATWFSLFVLPAAPAAQVETRLSAAAEDLAQRLPETWRGRALRTQAGTMLTGGQRAGAATLLWILGGLSALILVAGAANVGGVLLARVAAAERQTAIHLSMGAGRAAIVRRLLLEGALLGLLGGALALAGYAWARREVAQFALLPTLAVRLDVPFDATLISAVLILSGVVGSVLAIGPAVWSVRARPGSLLGAGAARTVGDRDGARVRRALVSAQVCASLVLVVGAALFARSLAALERTDVGFARQGLVAMDFDLEPAGLRGRSAAVARTALAAIAALPGVSAAAMANRAPIDASTPSVAVRRDRAGDLVGTVTMSTITSGYFDTVLVALVSGRAFTVEECDRGADVVIVNESLARRLWPAGDALGRALAVGVEQRALRVVGVAKDSKYRSMAETGQLHLYRPAAPAFHHTLLARVAGEPRAMLRAMQTALDGAGAGVVGFFPRTLDEHLAIELLPTRAAATVAAGLGLLALLLSAVGLYGLVAWFVERRRREIGVRLAIGARPADIVRLVVRQAVAATAPGLVAGLAVSALLAAAVQRTLYTVGPLDPVAFVLGVVVLTATAAAAAWLPGRRAVRVDPAVVLRDP